MRRNNRVNFLDVAIDAISYNELLEKVNAWLKNKNSRSHHIATINTYCVTLTLKNKRLLEIYQKADIAGPDGEPFKKWMNLFYGAKTDKICARDTMLQLLNKAKETNYSFYFYGGHPDVLEKMVENFKTQFPYINLVGFQSPPFRELTKEEKDDIIDNINTLKPDIIFVGLGTPKQDYWIDEHIEKIKGSVMVTCGATFDFFGGRVKMAPEWIQKAGFEWLFRLFGKDFKRLFYRYTVMNIVFLFYFLLQNVGLRKSLAKRVVRP